MMNKLKILYIEDDSEVREKLVKLLQDEVICGCKIDIKGSGDFNTSMKSISNYQMLILDIYEGNPKDYGSPSGKNVLAEIQKYFFIPVIFYSGNTSSVTQYKSQIVGVATKGNGGVEELKSEIERITKHNLPFLKEIVHSYIEKEFKKYFWDVIQKENSKFTPDADDFSLGYMLLRNFADSLSKENIKKLIGDDTIQNEKVHPMEFYIYPIDSSKEYENGEILKNKENDDIYVILTPSCDFVERFKKGVSVGRNVDKVFMVNTKLLTECNEYKSYIEHSGKNEIQELTKLINSGKSDRYFFLPHAPFIENRVIDFQLNISVAYDELKSKFDRIAKLDSPFAQSMTASFVRYYNRIGFPDIDNRQKN
ncbi:MAG: response regulator [Paludibacteraceae bacterium]|nr:response regulator [Paludibacteraceae bacterium]